MIARLLLLLLLIGPSAPAQPDAESLARRGAQAMERDDLPAAEAAFEALAEARPQDPIPRYNLACVRARLGDRAEAIDALHEALSLGFVDLHHMLRDPDLASLRDAGEIRLITVGWRDLLDARGEADLESARDGLGQRYRYERDDEIRLNIASAFDERSTAEALAEIERTAAWAHRWLFDLTPADDPRPDHWVTLVLPTPEHFAGFVPAQGVGGVYDRDRRLLVSRDLGPGLRHEFLHVLHHRHMDRQGVQHPIWVQEGLGCLPEDLEPAKDGLDRPVASWRTNIAKRLAERSRLTPWKRLFSMPRERFMGGRPNANYAQARAVFLFLFEKGALRDWLVALDQTIDEDPTGVAAFEKALGRPLEEIEREYAAWLRSLPEVAEEIRPGMPSLGAVVSRGDGEGPVVEEVDSTRGPLDERLRPRDIITAVNGRATRTTEDLVRVLSEAEIGEKARVEVRRGTRRLTITVDLVARPPDPR